MNSTAASRGAVRQCFSNAIRSMSSAGAASTEVRKLGVVGAGQMVSTIESCQTSMIKYLAGLRHSLSSISKSQGSSHNYR